MATVLIVDADQGFTESAQSALEAQGVTVHVRDDAPLEVVRKLRPTVIMLSVELPKGASTGFSICSRIRRDRELKALPILLTSSLATAEALKKHAASADHADDYAKKPLPIEDVVEKIGRLLANAPESEDPPNGDPATVDTPFVSFEEGFEQEHRTELRSPPPSSEPRAPTLSPRAEGSPAPPPIRAPIRREPTQAPASPLDEIWRSVRLDDALKSTLDLSEPQAPTKATPEERLAFLRQLVKYYETKDKVFRDVWAAVQQQGQELARRTLSLHLEGQNKDRRIDDLVRERDQVNERLLVVEADSKSFHEEITRIFREKDAEEQETRARLRQLEEESSELRQALKSAQQQTRDDAHRLMILQEEIGGLQAEKEDAEGKLFELTGALDETTRLSEELKARLGTTETVASERADEIDHLLEKLDSVAIDASQERDRLEGEYNQAIEHLKNEQAKDLTSLTRNHEEILGTLTGTHESETQSLAAEKAIAVERADELVAEIEALEQRLRSTELENAARTGEMQAEVESLEQTKADLTAQLEQTTESLVNVTEHRDHLTRSLETTTGELSDAKERIDALDAALDEERTEGRARAQELEAQLTAERTASQERLAQIEEDLEGTQNESFERLAELERLKKAHEKLQSKNQNLETSLKISEKALSAAESRGRSTDQELQTLRAASSGFEGRISELESDLSSAHETLAAREDELSGRERELSEAYASVTDFERRAHEAGSEIESLRNEQAAAKGREAALGEGLATAERDVRALEATEQALLKEIDGREERIALLESEADTLRAKVMSLEVELAGESARHRDLARSDAEGRARRTDAFSRLARALDATLIALSTTPSEELPEAGLLPPGVSEPAADSDPFLRALDALAKESLVPLKPSQPFGPLVREVGGRQAASAGTEHAHAAPLRGFADSFADEATNADGQALRRKGAPLPTGRAPMERMASDLSQDTNPNRGEDELLPLAEANDLPDELARALAGPTRKPAKHTPSSLEIEIDIDEGLEGEDDRNVITEVVRIDELK